MHFVPIDFGFKIFFVIYKRPFFTFTLSWKGPFCHSSCDKSIPVTYKGQLFSYFLFSTPVGLNQVLCPPAPPWYLTYINLQNPPPSYSNPEGGGSVFMWNTAIHSEHPLLGKLECYTCSQIIDCILSLGSCQFWSLWQWSITTCCLLGNILPYTVCS
jgi:hypothetical protein